MKCWLFMQLSASGISDAALFPYQTCNVFAPEEGRRLSRGCEDADGDRGPRVLEPEHAANRT